MAIQDKKTSEDEVSTTIDLEQLIGRAARDNDVKEAVFQVLFDKMMERLDQGRGADNKILPKYSKSYTESLAYKAFGKDGTVNMQLTGDMINSVQITKSSGGSMTVGFSGTEENAKAYAHMTGFEGHPTLEGKVKKRNFFGWTDKEIKDVAKEFKPRNEQEVLSDRQIGALIARLLG